MKEIEKIEKIEKRDGTTIIIGNGGTLIQSGKNTHTSDITSNHAPPPEHPEKKKSFQDIIAKPATIIAFILTLAGFLLPYFTKYYYAAAILVIIGILMFVFLVALNAKKA